jgi:hypothetical protein
VHDALSETEDELVFCAIKVLECIEREEAARAAHQASADPAQ